MHSLLLSLRDLLGLDLAGSDLELSHMTARAVIAFPCALLMTRIAGKRFLGRSAGFDIVLAIVLGSVVSRGINGQSAFFPTLGVGFVLVLLHRLIAMATCRSHWFSVFVKGRDCVLVRDGRVDRAQLRRSEFTEDDLLENLRLRGNVGTPDDVAEARLERNGQISVVHKKR